MRNDLTDITFIIDRSGSMMSCQTDAEGGVNSFIKEQIQQPGECLFTMVEFDHEYNFVHKGLPINQVPSYKLVPRGQTALLDAVGQAISETGERLAAMPEEQRPGLVVFVILTDGQENCSREFNKVQIKEMITHQSKKTLLLKQVD
jgi:Mg-chelatase subunit ChlD